MLRTRPDYFEEFSCIGGACPDTCCAGWQIVIDKESLEEYKNIKGPFGNRLQNEIDWEEEVFHQYKGDCCFLNDEGLCDIYLELGKDRLCATCGNYPRYTEEFEGLKEQFLCISCPVVADMLLGRKKKTELQTVELEEEEEDYEEFDFFLFTKLEDSREYLLKMLQDSKTPISQRISMALAFGHDAQKRINRDELFEIDKLLERYDSEHTVTFFEEKLKEFSDFFAKRLEFSRQGLAMLLQLEIRSEEWKAWLDKCKKKLDSIHISNYEKERKAYVKEQSEILEDWELYQEQIMVYFMLHYYCGAVYDDQLFAKIKLAAVSVYLIDEMLFVKWMLQKKKVIDKGDWVAVTYQYAREVEHSDDNLETLERMLTEKKCFSFEAILKAVNS